MTIYFSRRYQNNSTELTRNTVAKVDHRRALWLSGLQSFVIVISFSWGIFGSVMVAAHPHSRSELLLFKLTNAAFFLPKSLYGTIIAKVNSMWQTKSLPTMDTWTNLWSSLPASVSTEHTYRPPSVGFARRNTRRLVWLGDASVATAPAYGFTTETVWLILRREIPVSICSARGCISSGGFRSLLSVGRSSSGTALFGTLGKTTNVPPAHWITSRPSVSYCSRCEASMLLPH